MNLKTNLSSVTLEDNTVVEFIYEQGAEVFHYNETHIETAISETDVVDRVAEAATSGLPVTTASGSDMLAHLRSANLLEGYERGSHTFGEYVADAIRENFYDAELIEEDTRRYDHKRGFTTLSARVHAPAKEVLNNVSDFSTTFSGWTAHVKSNGGTFTFDV
jgi:hypothetical protein